MIYETGFFLLLLFSILKCSWTSICFNDFNPFEWIFLKKVLRDKIIFMEQKRHDTIVWFMMFKGLRDFMGMGVVF